MDKTGKLMTKIGDNELLGSYTFLIPENSTVRIPMNFKGWKFNLDIKYDNESEYEEPTVEVVPTVKDAMLVFYKWNNPLGTATIEPVKFGTLRGQKLLFMATSYQIGTVNKLDLQFLLEGV